MIQRQNNPVDAILETLDVAPAPPTRQDLRCEAEVTGGLSAMLTLAAGAAWSEGQRGLAVGTGVAAIGFGALTVRKLLGYGR